MNQNHRKSMESKQAVNAEKVMQVSIWRCTIFSMLLILNHLTIMALPIGQGEAQQRAAQFMAQRVDNGLRAKVKGKSGGLKDLEMVCQAPTVNGENAYYVFNHKDGGFVIISGDDETATILGYSDKGSFSTSDMPDAVRTMLDHYQKKMSTAEGKREMVSNHIKQEEKVRTATLSNIAPMIETQWDQGAPYNNLCPIDPKTGKRCITGCVTVAFAQLLYYHQWPIRGTGSFSYEYNGKTYSSDFSAHEYQWDKMKLTYEEKPEADPDNAVATLMYDCAIMTEENFGPYSTCGWWDTSRLGKYFGFNTYQSYLEKKSVSSTVFRNTLYTDLAKGYPVLIDGSDKDNYSHCWLIDGYEKGDYFHCNWGWGGKSDGNYLLSELLYPKELEIMYDICPMITTPWYLVTDDRRYVEMKEVGQLVAGNDDTTLNALDHNGNVLLSGFEEAFFTDDLSTLLGKKGDVNGDGVVNVVDVMIIVSYILHTPSISFYLYNGDMNSDGNINVTDVMGAVNVILNLSKNAPPLNPVINTGTY